MYLPALGEWIEIDTIVRETERRVSPLLGRVD